MEYKYLYKSGFHNTLQYNMTTHFISVFSNQCQGNAVLGHQLF